MIAGSQPLAAYAAVELLERDRGGAKCFVLTWP